VTNSPLESNYPVSSLTVAELEALITNIVQKAIREEKQKKVEENQGNQNLIPRPYGLWRGKVQMSDDFDILPDAIAAAFNGKME
jgi:hypothetical protein